MADTSDAAEKTGSLTNAPTDALKDAGQQLLGLLVQRATQAATERVGGLSDRLSGVAENGGTGLTSALRGGKDRDENEDDGDPDGGSGGQSRIGKAFSSIKEKITGALGGGGDGGGGGSGKKLKVTVISEDIDIGLPLRTTYNLWTQFGDFPGFMKKVETVDQESDEKTNWKAQVFWSHRTWEATIVEQVPDSHIVWKSKGAKGHVDGTVSFTEIGSNLTRVMLVLEYWPKGLFERTGNIWRAQGRRARLEFKHFRRHAMTDVILRQEEIEGWRGEIRDSEVVKTHEEALEEEQQSDDGVDEEQDAAADVTAEDEDGELREGDDLDADDEYEDEYDDEVDEPAEGDQADDEYDEVDEPADGDQVDDEVDEPAEGDQVEDEYDAEGRVRGRRRRRRPAAESAPEDGRGRRRRREPVAARSRRGDDR